MSSPLDIAKVAAAAADSKKAENVVMIDVSKMSDVADYFVIATAQTNPQTNAVLDEVEDRLRVSLGEKPLSIEGKQGLTWVLLDYGSVLVHVMQPEARDYYRLEKLWGDAPRVDLGLED